MGIDPGVRLEINRRRKVPETASLALDAHDLAVEAVLTENLVLAVAIDVVTLRG